MSRTEAQNWYFAPLPNLRQDTLLCPQYWENTLLVFCRVHVGINWKICAWLKGNRPSESARRVEFGPCCLYAVQMTILQPGTHVPLSHLVSGAIGGHATPALMLHSGCSARDATKTLCTVMPCQRDRRPHESHVDCACTVTVAAGAPLAASSALLGEPGSSSCPVVNSLHCGCGGS